MRAQNYGLSAQGVDPHVSRAEHAIVSIGDMPNDLPMREWVGIGVAVANAHSPVLQAADAIALSNDEDSVTHMLERLMKDATIP